MVAWILIVKAGWAMDQYLWKPLQLEDQPQRITELSFDDGGRRIWLGLPGEIRRYDHEGRFERPSFFLAGRGDVLSVQAEGAVVLAAAEDGLYVIDPQQAQARKVFSGCGKEEGPCRDMALANGTLYAADDQGVLYSSDEGRIWHRLKGMRSAAPVFKIKPAGRYVYFSTDHELYRLELETQRLDKVFDGGISQEASYGEESEEYVLERKLQAFDADISGERLVVAAASGAFQSLDAGERWQPLSRQGLESGSLKGIRFLKRQLPCHGEGARDGGAIPQGVPPGPGILAWGEEGVFVYENGLWKHLFWGISEQGIIDTGEDWAGNVFALTQEQVYRLVLEHRPRVQYSPERFASEPEIQEVQRMAIRYADMDPSKIQRWHRQSRLKALVPSFSLGIDRNSSELWHWDTGQSPDSIVKGRELTDWDMSLSWDLSDIVWSSDQTSIDSRSKLVAELREDVLGQVTRIYFARRRLQMEIESMPEEQVAWSRLRIDELTAMLDAYTGGSFSKYGENN